MDKVETIRAFVRVAELKSFTQAAQSLGLPKASVSHAIQLLESQVGARLLHRTTRHVQVTQDGNRFYEQCKLLLSDIDELEGMFRCAPNNIRGRLRVDMPTAIAKNIVLPKLPEFLLQYPEVELELSATDKRVDVIGDGFDCVLRVGSLVDSDLIARPLGDIQVVSCVSPHYVAQYGEPRDIDSLCAHYLVHFTPTLGAKPSGWKYWLDKECRSVDMQARVVVNNAEAYIGACLAGLGIIQAPLMGVRSHLENGSLVEVLKAYSGGVMPISLIYPNRKHLSRRLQIFMDWLADLIQSEAAMSVKGC